jgi:hypothetical protein
MEWSAETKLGLALAVERQNAIEATVGSTPGFQWLSASEVDECWESIQTLAGRNEIHLPVEARSGFTTVADMRGEAIDHVQETLQSILVADVLMVDVVWQWSSLGARISTPAFLNALETLWSPAKDDVYILTIDRREVVLLHHEEFISVASTPPRSG